VQEAKRNDFNFPAKMDGTNISVILDDDFFKAYRAGDSLATIVYWDVIQRMCETGEPGFSVDVGVNSGENNRNACSELCSRDDNDVCNLGALNLSRITSIEELEATIAIATGFMVCGTLISKVPYPAIAEVRDKNRRIGLGLMGVHEWLLVRGKKYGPDEELGKWLQVYKDATTKYTREWCDKLKVSQSVKTRAIAPTGTIAIIGETTSGIEPMFCLAFKRRYLKGDKWYYQYVIDATGKRLIQRGVRPDDIEDAYALAKDVERRIAFQAWVQKYVDHCISSTINLPTWGTRYNNELTVRAFGNTLMKYLPSLRGITVYPDGSRGGQPFTPVSYAEAIRQVGVEFEEGSEKGCKNGVCGI
jgi:ribonucleoside-diphosphate reductase alpha chain